MQFVLVTNQGTPSAQTGLSKIHVVSCSDKPGTSPVALPRAKIHAVSCSDKLGTSPVELAV